MPLITVTRQRRRLLVSIAEGVTTRHYFLNHYGKNEWRNVPRVMPEIIEGPPLYDIAAADVGIDDE